MTIQDICRYLVCICLVFGCGEDEPTPSVAPFETCLDLEGETLVSGQFYTDEDRSEYSAYTGGYSDEDTPVLPTFSIVGADPAAYQESRCMDGTYTVGGLDSGTYLMAPERLGRDCSTNNCSSSFANAMKENRRAIMVTFGDSVAVYGEAPMFPERFVTLMSGLGEVENRNVAVAGSTSNQWLPGGSYFEARLSPHLADADLVVITIGGNDLVALINDAASLLADIPGAIEEARQTIQQVIENLRTMISAIREINANVDIAFCLYPDYTQATGTIWGTINTVIGAGKLGEMLSEARAAFPNDDPNLILVDLYGAAQGLALTDYLWTRPNGQIDPLHFGAKGQVLYAEELFTTMGGILIGDSPLGELGTSPIGLDRDFGFTP